VSHPYFSSQELLRCALRTPDLGTAMAAMSLVSGAEDVVRCVEFGAFVCLNVCVSECVCVCVRVCVCVCVRVCVRPGEDMVRCVEFWAFVCLIVCVCPGEDVVRCVGCSHVLGVRGRIRGQVR